MKIVEIKNSKNLWPLRNLVLWRHKILLDCGMEGDLKKSTFHIGAVDADENVLGTSTYINQTNDNFNDIVQYRLRAMATHPSIRGTGAGKKMIEKGLEKLKEKKADVVWCDARIEATEFYKKMGFETVGEIYEVPKIGPHKLMYFRLNPRY